MKGSIQGKRTHSPHNSFSFLERKMFFQAGENALMFYCLLALRLRRFPLVLMTLDVHSYVWNWKSEWVCVCARVCFLWGMMTPWRIKQGASTLHLVWSAGLNLVLKHSVSLSSIPATQISVLQRCVCGVRVQELCWMEFLAEQPPPSDSRKIFPFYHQRAGTKEIFKKDITLFYL